MNLSVGIVGLPNVGKSTLFNALLKKQQALVANYPFATIEPNVGIVAVPDERLLQLAEITKSEHSMSELPPIKPATVEFVDIAGLVKGASEGAGLGNKFLAHIREVRIIAHVVRAFEDENVVKEGSVDVKSDYETIRIELELSDLEKKGEPLAKKPEIIVINLAESDYSKSKIDEQILRYSHVLENRTEQIIAISAKIEEELAALSEEEQRQYLLELGLKESGLERLIKKAYQELGLISFLTAGEKEVHAWTIRRGQTALEASGEIHTDFMKKFIKAEVIPFDDFVAAGGWKKARELGKVRLEGRDYIVQDGDVIEFKIGT
ncbi:MAG: redox-regulated ATPase YchF [Candidatus Levybacteria bacterium]|nr:redox-regulated ATPase YchF [Candidatus Levybacteria bacterium]